MEQRHTTLAFAILATLSAGTNYLFSTYSPQLAASLALSSTQINSVGISANLGVYLSGELADRTTLLAADWISMRRARRWAPRRLAWATPRTFSWRLCDPGRIPLDPGHLRRRTRKALCVQRRRDLRLDRRRGLDRDRLVLRAELEHKFRCEIFPKRVREYNVFSTESPLTSLRSAGGILVSSCRPLESAPPSSAPFRISPFFRTTFPPPSFSSSLSGPLPLSFSARYLSGHQSQRPENRQKGTRRWTTMRSNLRSKSFRDQLHRSKRSKSRESPSSRSETFSCFGASCCCYLVRIFRSCSQYRSSCCSRDGIDVYQQCRNDGASARHR